MMTMDEEMDEDDRVQILMALRNWAIALAGPEKTSVEFDFNGQRMISRWIGHGWTYPVRKLTKPYLVR